MRPSAPAVAARPPLSSTTALTASAWKRSTCSAALRASDQRIAVESKLPVTAVCPSDEIASARTGPPWPRNCAKAVVTPSRSITDRAVHVRNAGRRSFRTRSIRGNRLFRPIKMSDNALVAPSEPELAHARPVAVETLGLEIVEVILKAPLGVLSEIAQKRPGIDAGGVHVVEAEPHRIIADRIDGENGDVALAADRLALCFGVTLHFGGRAGYAQQFRGKAESLSIVKCDMEGAAVLGEPDFKRPRRAGVRYAQGTVPLSRFGARPIPGGLYPFGPTRLWPGSPTRAPPVVNATELGSWMALSNIDTPTAAIAANNKAARKAFMALPRLNEIIRPPPVAANFPTTGPWPALLRPRAS